MPTDRLCITLPLSITRRRRGDRVRSRGTLPRGRYRHTVAVSQCASKRGWCCWRVTQPVEASAAADQMPRASSAPELRDRDASPRRRRHAHGEGAGHCSGVSLGRYVHHLVRSCCATRQRGHRQPRRLPAAAQRQPGGTMPRPHDRCVLRHRTAMPTASSIRAIALNLNASRPFADFINQSGASPSPAGLRRRASSSSSASRSVDARRAAWRTPRMSTSAATYNSASPQPTSATWTAPTSIDAGSGHQRAIMVGHARRLYRTSGQATEARTRTPDLLVSFMLSHETIAPSRRRERAKV